MATKQQTVDFILEQLGSLDASARKMFGEYALYIDGKIPALVCDDTLYVKILLENTDLAARLATGQAYPGSKPYYIVPGDRLEESAWLQDLMRTTAAALPAK